MIVAVVPLATLLKIWLVSGGLCGLGLVAALIHNNAIPQPSHVKSGAVAVIGTVLALTVVYLVHR